MATQIKITQLTDIGSANLAVTTLLPVVNMAGVPTTQKTTLGNLANVILSQSGGNYAAVGTANIAYSVANAAQPNITSVGTLTNVAVSGNATVNGNITSNGTAYVGNLSTTGLASITTLTVGSSANLGAVANVTITGGSNGQVLTTNGSNVLSWTTVSSGNSSYGDSNVVSLMAAFGSNTITTTGNITGGNVLTSANVIANGAIESGTGLTTGGYLSVDGNTDLHNTIVTGNLSATGNITANNLGNISAINLTGSNSNVLYGNGVFAPASGGGNANTGNVTFNDINIIGTGNLHLQPDPANASSYLDVFLSSGPDLHLVASNGANLILGEDDGPNVMASWDGNVYVQSWNTGTGNVGGVWTFGEDGNLTLPANAFNVNYANGTQVSLGGGGISGIAVQDEGTNVVASANTINFVGNGVTASNVGGVATVTISGNISQISNGNSNVSVPTSSDNVYITTNDGTSKQWIFNKDGSLRTPGNVDIYGAINFPQQVSNINWSTYNIELSQYGRITTNVDFFANANVIGAQYLKGDGSNISNIAGANVSGLGNIVSTNLTGSNSNVLYGNGVFAPIAGGNVTYGNSDVATFLAAYGSNTITTTGNVSVGNISTNGTLTIGNAIISEINPIVLGFTNDIYVSGDVLSRRLKSNTGTVALNASNSTANIEWAFNVNGTLTLPQPPASSNVSTSIQSIYGNSSTFVDFVSNNSANFTFGTTANHNIVLITGLNQNDNRWVLGYDGNLTVPGNLVIAGNTNVFGTDSALIQPTDGTPLIAISSGANGAVSSVWVEDIGNIGTSNIAAIYANPIPGSGIVRIAVGQNGGNAGPNLWDFNANGTTIFPGDLIGNGASPAPSINGFNSISSITLSASGNITGGNIITGGVVSATGNVSGNFFLGNGSQLTGITATSLVNGTSNVVTTNNSNVTIGIAGNAAIATFTGTGANVTGTLNVTGNVTAQGVGTNLVRRANTISGSNTAVTLDNLNAYVGGTPKRLYIGAATSNMTMAGTSQTMSTGALAVSSWINVPIVTGTGNGFAMSGAITNDGDTVVLNVTDQGAGSGTWRVTGMIANTSANLYSVSIERLA